MTIHTTMLVCSQKTFIGSYFLIPTSFLSLTIENKTHRECLPGWRRVCIDRVCVCVLGSWSPRKIPRGVILYWIELVADALVFHSL